MRKAAVIIASILSKHTQCDTSDLADWFRLFLRRLFILFRLASRRGRYIRRIHMLCQVLSPDHLSGIPFVQAAAQQCVSTIFMLAQREHLDSLVAVNYCEFVEDYFVIEKSASCWSVLQRDI